MKPSAVFLTATLAAASTAMLPSTNVEARSTIPSIAPVTAATLAIIAAEERAERCQTEPKHCEKSNSEPKTINKISPAFGKAIALSLITVAGLHRTSAYMLLLTTTKDNNPPPKALI